MSKRKVKTVINFLGERLKANGLSVSKIILFGSQADKTAREDSDIDIFIISNDFRRKNIFKRGDLIKEAEISTIRKFMVPLDIIMMTPEELQSENSLMAAYAKQGEVVYSSETPA